MNAIVLLALAIPILRRETGGDWSRLLPAAPAALACAAATAGAFVLVALPVGFVSLRLAGVRKPGRVRLPILHSALYLALVVIVAFGWALEPVDPAAPFTTRLFDWWDFVSGAAVIVFLAALFMFAICWWAGFETRRRARRAGGELAP